MKVLAIVSTKRKNGLVSKITLKVLEGAQASGHEIETINLYDYTINYCLGCWGCKRKGLCVINDDFNSIFEKVRDADVLILSSPTYWSNVSGIMKSFFDRQCGMAMSHSEGKEILGKRLPLGFGAKNEMKGKKAIFITACTTPFPFNYLMDESRNVIRAMHHYTRKIQAKVISKIIYSDSRFLNLKNKTEKILNKAFKIGKNL